MKQFPPVLLFALFLFGCASPPEEISETPRKPETVMDVIIKQESEPQAVVDERDSHRSLSRFFMVNQASRMLPQDLYPYHKDGKIYAIYRDINGDLLEDLLLLALEADSWDGANRSYMGNLDRLYESPDLRESFIYTFIQNRGQLELDEVIPCGGHQVFGNFSAFSLDPEGEDFLLKVTFPKEEKVEVAAYLWGGDRKSLDLYRDKQRDFYITQLNENQQLDILVSQRGFEEGLGYETFLTWLEWEDNRFVERDSMALLRSLREFLLQLEMVLYNKDWNYLLGNMVDMAVLNRLRARGLTEDEILERLFRSTGVSTLYWDFEPQQVSLPEPLENPFSLNERGQFSFWFRILSHEGQEIFFEASIGLKKNPFGKQKFNLLFD